MSEYLKFIIEITVSNDLCTTTNTYEVPFICPFNFTEEEERAAAEKYAEKYREMCVDSFPFEGEVEVATIIACYEMIEDE